MPPRTALIFEISTVNRCFRWAIRNKYHIIPICFKRTAVNLQLSLRVENSPLEIAIFDDRCSIVSKCVGSNKCTSFDPHYCRSISSPICRSSKNSIYYRTALFCLKSAFVDGKGSIATTLASDCGTELLSICAALDLNRCIIIRTGKADECTIYSVVIVVKRPFTHVFHSRAVSIDRHMAFDHFDQHIPDICGHVTGNVDDHVIAILNIYRDRSGILAALHCIRTAGSNAAAGFWQCLCFFLRGHRILRFCARLRRKRAHWQNRQHHAHRKCCTEKSRTLFSHVLFPFSFVILQAPTPKGTVCSLSLPPHTTYQEAFC